MNTTKFSAILCIIATTAAQSAANDVTTTVPVSTTAMTSVSDDAMKSIFGFAPGARGTHAFVQSSELSEEPNCAITIVHSHNPAYSAERLGEIAKEIHNLKTTDDGSMLYELCEAKTKESAIENRIDSGLTVLYAALNSELMQYVGYSQFYDCLCSAKPKLWEKINSGIFPEFAKTDHYFLLFSKEPVTDPQAKAELEQKNNSENPVTLIVNLNAWRKVIEAHRLMKSIFGFAPGKGGKCAFIQSSELSEDPTCAVTVAHSDDPTYNYEQLQQLAEEIHRLKIIDSFTLYKLCEAKTKKLAIENRIDEDLTPIIEKSPYDLIVLHTILNSELMQYAGYRRSCEGLCGNKLELWKKTDSGIFPESAKATCYLLIPSEEPVIDPQTKAKLEQEKNLKNPFTLIVNLHAWRDCFEEIKKTDPLIIDEDAWRKISAVST